jgi:hypothetical protein
MLESMLRAQAHLLVLIHPFFGRSAGCTSALGLPRIDCFDRHTTGIQTGRSGHCETDSHFDQEAEAEHVE